jgi:hypothetical protein
MAFTGSLCAPQHQLRRLRDSVIPPRKYAAFRIFDGTRNQQAARRGPVYESGMKKVLVMPAAFMFASVVWGCSSDSTPGGAVDSGAPDVVSEAAADAATNDAATCLPKGGDCTDINRCCKRSCSVEAVGADGQISICN